MIGADLQGSADPVERMSLPASVPERVLLDAAPDLIDHGGSEFYDVEVIQDCDDFGQFVADRVCVAAERIQRRCLDAGGEFLAAVFEPVSVGLPRPTRNEVQQPGVRHALGITGVVHDPGDHPVPGRPDVGPDMLIDAKRIHPCPPASRCDPPGRLYLDGVPDRVPGDAELVGQGAGHRVLFGEGGPRAVRVRAAPDTLGPEQTHGPAETGKVMEPDLAASVTDRNDTAVRTISKIITGLDLQNQA